MTRTGSRNIGSFLPVVRRGMSNKLEMDSAKENRFLLPERVGLLMPAATIGIL